MPALWHEEEAFYSLTMSLPSWVEDVGRKLRGNPDADESELPAEQQPDDPHHLNSLGLFQQVQESSLPFCQVLKGYRLNLTPAPGRRNEICLPCGTLPGFPLPKLGAQTLLLPCLRMLQQAVITQSCCWWVGSEDADTEFSRAGNSQSSSRPPKSHSENSLGIKHSVCFVFPMNWKYCEDDPCLHSGWPFCFWWTLVASREMTTLGNINLCVKTTTKGTHTT